MTYKDYLYSQQMNFNFVNINDYAKCSGKLNNIPQTNLYITDQFGVSDANQLLYYGIKHVFNVSPIQLKEFPGINYYHLPILDNPQQNILQFFDEVFSKMDKITCQRENMVINCQAGVSRSASFLIGYLIKNGLSYDTSYLLVKSHRPVINPNQGFVEQLKRYESIVKNGIRPKRNQTS
jgi:protein-tyrosine phosphatase